MHKLNGYLIYKQENFMNIKTYSFALLILIAGFTINTHAADINTGKAKSSVCVACHGVSGISSNPLWPNLAGQQKGYLEKQLKSFRSGERKDPLMSPMALNLNDNDIQNLAAYYNSIK